MIKLIECPRDAMQGLKDFIPTKSKVDYLNLLLEVGFDILDFGSFVSPRAIPQMADTKDVVKQLRVNSKTNLLSIIANVRGAIEACAFEQIKYIGFPFSVSETFQLRNTNSTISESLDRVEDIVDLCVKFDKKPVIYISMAFGNPYGDFWSPELVLSWMNKLDVLSIDCFVLSDTIGVANPHSISSIFNTIIALNRSWEIGSHFHTVYDHWRENLEAAYNTGCTRFDGAIGGFGGCPMAKNELVGNMPTEKMVEYLISKNANINLNWEKFEEAIYLSKKILTK